MKHPNFYPNAALPAVFFLLTIFLPFLLAAAANDPLDIAPEAVAEDSTNTLTWVAPGDPDVVAYRVEWSHDGTAGWSVFGTLPASTDTLNATRYRVRDKNPRPESHYRIVVVARDGGERVSQVATVLRSRPPVPLAIAYDSDAGAARMELNLELGGSITVSVLAASGDAIYQKSILVVRGRSLSKLPLGILAPGTYRVEVVLPDGNLVTDRFSAASR